MSVSHRTLAYLGQPYWHEDAWIRDQRVRWGARAAAYLMEHSEYVFSPIAHAAEIRNQLVDPHKEPEFWLSFDKVIFNRCDFLLILPLVGWKESHGLATEVGWANSLNKPIFQLQGTIPGIPASAFFPTQDYPVLRCDQFGPKGFPSFLTSELV